MAMDDVQRRIMELQEGYPRERAFAAILLGLSGDKRAVEPLIKALGSEDAGVRRAAAWALGDLSHELSLGDAQALVPALEPLKKLLADPHGDVRRAAAYAITEIKAPFSEEISKALLDAAIRHKDAHLFIDYLDYLQKSPEAQKRVREGALKRIEGLPAQQQRVARNLLNEASPPTVRFGIAKEKHAVPA